MSGVGGELWKWRVWWKLWKAKGRRDSHIPTAPTSGGKVENQKQVSHFPAYGCGLSGGIFRRGGRAVARLVRGEQKAIRRLSRQGRIIVVDRE